MKSIVELLNELGSLSTFEFGARIGVTDLNVAESQKIDFNNWLRRSVPQRTQYRTLQDAYEKYFKTFG